MNQPVILSSPSVNSVVLHDATQRQWLQFQQPLMALSAHSLEEVRSLLETVQAQVDQQKLYAAGFVSYEAAPAFDAALPVRSDTGFPLAWFGLYELPTVVALPEPSGQDWPAIDLQWSASISQERYQTAIAQIKQYIQEGLTYQVNFSFRLTSPFDKDPWLYFLQLMQAQNGFYGAYISLKDWSICSASPELFFAGQQHTLTCRPMKGTAARGLTYSSDRQQAAWLSHSEKNRAENVMIVDMIRNDLGKIARTGTVNVTQLFNLEPYPTLWQMTSSVSCQTTAPLPEIMRSLFPCASITGAPKPQTMQIIAELEDTPRRIYTGAIGFIAPERRSQFSVAIRTVLIDKTQQRAEYGVGGGIVWDSTAAAEFEECCTKAKVLTQPPPEFSLLETLLWTAESNYFLLDLHLQRLSDSASYFSFPIDVEEIRRQLMQITEQMTSDRYKVRLLVSRQGDLTCDWQPLAKPSKEPLRITISPAPIDSNHVFLYHKTTHRQVYQQAQRSHPDFDDVLLWNEKGELTESCIANLVVELEGQYYTPPVSCGLLAGTMRSSLLEQGMIQERVILLQELQQCSRIFLVNSVRQMREAIVF